MVVQLRTEVPVFSAVLTPQQFHESAPHFEFFRRHFATKGVEVAEACANTLLSLERLRGQVAAGIGQAAELAIPQPLSARGEMWDCRDNAKKSCGGSKLICPSGNFGM